MSEEWRNRIIGSGEVDPNELLANPRNWRIHPLLQQEALLGVLSEVGWVGKILVNKRTGFVVDGHLRVALAIRYEQTSVPVDYTDLTDEEERLVLVTFDPIAALAETDREQLAPSLEMIETENEQVQNLINLIAHREDVIDYDELGAPAQGKVNLRDLPLDAFFTITGHDGSCCIACQTGLKYGTQSRANVERVCAYSYRKWHKLDFIDNDYRSYDHDLHLAFVAHHKPKYATVRDVMTKAQCDDDGIEFYELAQILDFAAELEQHAENVIVIPKYDCLDEIPDRYVLGYSIPTSHGGTPLSYELFEGRRVHLLGGSWKRQVDYLAALGDDVVSLDNNYIQLSASFAGYITPDGKTRNLSEHEGFERLHSPRFIALALSFAAMATKIAEIKGTAVVQPESDVEEYRERA